jgi:hypothetical protein
LKFIISDNFIRPGADTLRAIEKQSDFPVDIDSAEEMYGRGTPVQDLLTVIANQSASASLRQTVMVMDDGIKKNKVSLAEIRNTKCHWVYLSRAWANMDLMQQLSKLVIAWPAIKDAVSQANARGQQCKFEVSVNGKISTTVL